MARSTWFVTCARLALLVFAPAAIIGVLQAAQSRVVVLGQAQPVMESEVLPKSETFANS